MVAKQLHWDEIWNFIRQVNLEDGGNTYAIVKMLKLNVNHITLELWYVFYMLGNYTILYYNYFINIF